jgi:S-DNA-T family DNA segregation ATPase FtsK/SpoIIIE
LIKTTAKSIVLIVQQNGGDKMNDPTSQSPFGKAASTGTQRSDAPLLTPDQQNVITTVVVKLAQLGHEVVWQTPVTVGPLITTYRFLPRAAAKVAQIASCADDLALALKVEDVLVRRLPGEAAVGVSVPNAMRQPVLWRDLLAAPSGEAALPLNFGVDSEGKPFREDLAQLPHLLVTGATNGGKSVFIRSLIASLIYWQTPEQVQFILSDTKKVEFGHFIGAPHLLFEPSRTKYDTWERMDWLTEEVDRRLRVLAAAGVQNINQYHKQGGRMPYIVFVIDELYHILCGGERGESKIADGKLGRIVSESRAAGVHVIGGTQRSSVDIIAGSIKANFPARLTFRLPSQEDSRTIIGHSGAEHLLARGDMLYCSPNHPATFRLHSGYASTEDIVQCVSFAAHKTGQVTK